MEVLLNKLNYRLYEMEASCLSYPVQPLDSLIDLKDGLVYLNEATKEVSSLAPLSTLTYQLTLLVSSLQQNYSPFSSTSRNLFLEFIDLFRQAVLAQEYYGSDDSNLILRLDQGVQLLEKIKEESTKNSLMDQNLNCFEADLEQDDEVWLDTIMDFIERFSRVGTFTFAGGVDYRSSALLDREALFGQLLQSSQINIKVKTGQSLIWVQSHFNQFEWRLSKRNKPNDGADLASVFMALRRAKELIPKSKQRKFRYSTSYHVLERLYLSANTRLLAEVAKTLSDYMDVPIKVLSSQAQLVLSKTAIQDLYAAIKQQNLVPNGLSFTLRLFDFAGTSRLLLVSDEFNKKQWLAYLKGSEVTPSGVYLDTAYDVSVLESELNLIAFDDGMIVIPSDKCLSILEWDHREYEYHEETSLVSIEFENLGLLDVFLLCSFEKLTSSASLSVMLIQDVEVTYGILFEGKEEQKQGYKLASFGLSAGTRMLWYLDHIGVVPEINPLALMAPIAAVEVSEDNQDLVTMPKSGWMANIAGNHVCICPKLVKKHLSLGDVQIVMPFGGTSPLVYFDGICYSLLRGAEEGALSILLLQYQGFHCCLAVNSIYYERNTDQLLQEMENVERLYLPKLSIARDSNLSNTLYVIDVKSV